MLVQHVRAGDDFENILPRPGTHGQSVRESQVFLAQEINIDAMHRAGGCLVVPVDVGLADLPGFPEGSLWSGEVTEYVQFFVQRSGSATRISEVAPAHLAEGGRIHYQCLGSQRTVAR
jgi:hypothetical protein